MNILELDSYSLADAVKFNDRLNPRIWQGNVMRPEVRAKLLEIAADFQQSLGIPDLDIKDITVSGSNAGYTYTDHSDIDLHLVVEMPEQCDEVYQELFNAKKYQYNDEHDIRIGGYDVELYVQPADQPHVSAGVYSVANNDWIHIPRKIRTDVDDAGVRNKYEDVKARVESAVKSGSIDRMQALWDKIKDMRKTGLAKNGELGPENLAFKMLRTQGVIAGLKDAIAAARDQELSLAEQNRVKAPVRYGFRSPIAEVGLSPDGVSPETKMFLSEKPRPTHEEIIRDFFKYAIEQLGIAQVPGLKLKKDPQWSIRNQSFGRYDNNTGNIDLAVGNRHIMDVLRTLAHELMHRKQDERDTMPPDAGETGSPYENEAHVIAGILMREYADRHPEYFEDVPVSESASGYIPTAKQKNDPRYKMALTVDIRPGQVGKEANKMALKTDSQGRPGLLMKTVNLREGRVWDGNDPPGPEFRPTMPRGTVRVDVSDVYDWYKLGKHMSDLAKARPGEFGKGPPSTIVSFGDEDTEHKYIHDLEKLGLKTTDIDPVDPNQPADMPRQSTDPTYNVDESVGNPLIDLTPNFPNYTKLIGEFLGVANNRLQFRIVAADLKPGAKPTDKIVRAQAADRPIGMALNYVKNRKVIGQDVEEGRVIPGNFPLQQQQAAAAQKQRDYEEYQRHQEAYEDKLKRLAAWWWNNDENPAIERKLAAMGLEIGQDEGYDSGGVFIIAAGDTEGKTYISWPAEELEQLKESTLVEFAPGSGGDRGNYLLALATAWYTHDIEMLKDIIGQGGSPMRRIMDAQEAVEKILQRGIHCADGRVRKYNIDYNPGFNGVIVFSDDYYEHSETNDAGSQIDSRTGRPWGPYEFVEFSDAQLGGGIGEGVAKSSDNLNYIGNCTDDDVIEHIFGDATNFAQAVEEHGDEFTIDDLVVKYDPETDVHSFYYKKPGVAEGDKKSNHWYNAGVKDATRGVKPNPRTYLSTMQDKKPRHPEEIFHYMAGYRSVANKPAAKEHSITEGDDLIESLRREFALLEDEVLGEIRMSPSNLKKEAAKTGAQAGIEFEMIVPGVGESSYEDFEPEPDYEYDESVRGIDDAVEFFRGDYNDRRTINNLRDEMTSQYYDWLDEIKREKWEEDSADYIRDWLRRTYEGDWREEAEQKAQAEAPEFGMNADEIQNRVEEIVQELWDERYEDVMANLGEDWDAAYEEWSDDFNANVDMEDEWLASEGWNNMSDIESNFDVAWPYWTEYDNENSATDINHVADEFSDAIGMPVNASSQYHGATRRPGQWVVEPDRSIEPENDDEVGLEFVSPPMPIDEMIEKMNAVRKWAGDAGAYTNDSTGLHINISVPNYDLSKLDYVKLALLMGDEYVLDQFGRSSNHYTKAAMSKIRGAIKGNPAAAEAVLAKMKGHMDDLATKAIHSGTTDKYTSVNTKSGYIEFRSPGGDWLDTNWDKVENTLLRFTVALSAAMDPAAYRREYQKKLYKLLSPRDDRDPVAYFAKYAAGELDKSDLRDFVKQVQLQRRIERGQTGTEQFWWRVSNPGHSFGEINVVARTPEEAIERALEPDGYPDWRNRLSNLKAVPLRPFSKEPLKARVGEPQPLGRGTGEPIPGSTIDLQRQRLAPTPDQRQGGLVDVATDNWSSDFERRVSQPAPPGNTGREFAGWRVLLPTGEEVYRFSGVGNSQADANRIAAEWLRNNGRGVSGEGYEVVPVWREA